MDIAYLIILIFFDFVLPTFCRFQHINSIHVLLNLHVFLFICCCSIAKSCLTLCDPLNCSTPDFLSFTISQSLFKLMSIESVMPFNHLILYHPFLLLPSIFPSIRVFSNESALCTRWPKYWSFSFSIIPSKEIPGLIPFRMDWLDLLAVQGTLKSLHYYFHSNHGH